MFSYFICFVKSRAFYWEIRCVFVQIWSRIYLWRKLRSLDRRSAGLTLTADCANIRWNVGFDARAPFLSPAYALSVRLYRSSIILAHLMKHQKSKTCSKPRSNRGIVVENDIGTQIWETGMNVVHIAWLHVSVDSTCRPNIHRVIKVKWRTGRLRFLLFIATMIEFYQTSSKIWFIEYGTFMRSL